MQLIGEAWKALQDRLSLVFAYVGAHGLLFLLVGLLEWSIGFDHQDDVVPPAMAALNLVDQLLLAAAVAAVQAVIFARLGKDLDKPLWKCAGDAEALRRFFVPWFLLNLVYTVLGEIGNAAARNELASLYQFIELAKLLYLLAYLPVGTCIMYWGRFEWNELGEALRPITRQFSLVMSVILLQLAQHAVNVTLALSLSGIDPADIRFVLVVAVGVLPITLLEVLAFVTMWRILMINRDAPDDDNEDFDF